MIKMLRLIRWAALGLIVLLALGVAILEFGHGDWWTRPIAEDASAGAVSVPGGVSIGGHFHLIDDKGHPVTDADYRGRWLLIFFGYTNCPDECPLTLQKMATALDEIGPLADKVAPLFITVDPARDAPARLAEYLRNFGPRIVGLTGSDEQIATVAKAYRAYYSPVEHEKSGADVVSHSTFLYLMNPTGTFAALIPSDVDADKLANTLRTRLAAKS